MSPVTVSGKPYSHQALGRLVSLLPIALAAYCARKPCSAVVAAFTANRMLSTVVIYNTFKNKPRLVGIAQHLHFRSAPNLRAFRPSSSGCNVAGAGNAFTADNKK